jgi:uncharacterized protein YodC (DUF2158 family)
MELKTGDVVMLKSGGQPLTVAEVKGDDVLCLWIGTEGDLFRETLPLATLERLEELDKDEDDEDDEE